jgi:hypothetical protein
MRAQLPLPMHLELLTDARLLPTFWFWIASCARYLRRWVPSAHSWLAFCGTFGQALEMETAQSEGTFGDKGKGLDQLTGVVIPGRSIEWYLRSRDGGLGIVFLAWRRRRLVSDDGECPTSLGDNLIDFLVDIALQIDCKD